MQFLAYLPDEFKETVQVIRYDPVEKVTEDVASKVVCWIEPDTTMSGNQVVVEDGIPIHYQLYTGHLETPVPNIKEGDDIVSVDKGKLRVYSIRPFGEDVMQLILRRKKVL